MTSSRPVIMTAAPTHRNRRRRRRVSSPPMRSTTLLPLSICGGLALFGGVHAGQCSQSELNSRNMLLDKHKALFTGCLGDLKLPTEPSSTSTPAVDIWTRFISDDYLKRADAVCGSESCVKALIRTMEDFPDCCSETATPIKGSRNLPRLADDLLHECDILDARQLAAELEAEIEKLPDLKVQIKSVGLGPGHSLDGSGGAAVGDAGVDVIIDVKKREMMRNGKLGLGQNAEQASAGSGVGEGQASTASTTTMTTTAAVAMATMLSLFL